MHMVSRLRGHKIGRRMSEASHSGGMRRRARTAEQRLARLEVMQSVLADVAHDLGPAVELQPVLDRVMTAMRSMVEFRGGSICLVEDGLVRIAVADPPADEERLNARMPVGEGLSGVAINS